MHRARSLTGWRVRAGRVKNGTYLSKLRCRINLAALQADLLAVRILCGVQRMNVWLVGAGEYSDFGIDAVFSTEEKANAHIDKLEQCSDRATELIEMVVDAEEDVQVVDKWKVVLNADGSLAEEYRCGATKILRKPNAPHEIDSFANEDKRKFFGFSTRGYDHALKLAGECRQAWLRTGGHRP